MRESECYRLSFGVESASPDVLKRMNKTININKSEYLLKVCNSLGIQIAINLIVGFPGETRDDFMRTVDFVRKNGHIFSGIGIEPFWLAYKSDVYNNPRKYGIIRSKESDYEKSLTYYNFEYMNKIDVKSRIQYLRKVIYQSTFRNKHGILRLMPYSLFRFLYFDRHLFTNNIFRFFYYNAGTVRLFEGIKH